MMLLVALPSCGAREAGKQASRGSTVRSATLPKIALASDAFLDGQPIPPRYSCDGANRAPPLHWDKPPAATRSFALVLDDPDAPAGTFRHWAVYNIPASARSIGTDRVGSEAGNDFGKPGYGGPCPPQGNGPHHYHFKLFALGVDRLDLRRGARAADVERAAERHAIGRGELVGTFERSSKRGEPSNVVPA